MLFELAIPFVASVFITLILRRLDKSNLNMRKLKNLIERGQKELLELTLQKKEELQDATTQFDLLLVNSEKYLNSLKVELESARGSLNQVQESKNDLLQMDGELQSLENTTKSVKDQLRFVNESLDKIDTHQKKIKRLQDHIKTVDEDAARLIKLFQDALRDKSEEILGALEKKFEDITTETGEYHNTLREQLLQKHDTLTSHVNESYRDLETSLKDSARELSLYLEERIETQMTQVDELQEKIRSNEQSLNVTIPAMILDIKNDLKGDLEKESERLEMLQNAFVEAETNFRKKIEAFRDEIENQRAMLFQDLFGEAEKIRNQIQTLDLETLAKKDEIIMATRNEAGKIQDQIENFNDLFVQAKESLYKEAETREAEVIEQIDALRAESERILESVDSANAQSERRIQQSINGALEDIKDRATSAFRTSYADFVSDSEQLQAKMNLLDKHFDTLTEKFDELSMRLDREFQDYLKQVKRSASESAEHFETEMSEKQSLITEQIKNLEDELNTQKDRATEDIEKRMARLFNKLGTIEKNLVESQQHLVGKWQVVAIRQNRCRQRVSI